MEEIDRKEIRKNHLEQKNKKKHFVDDETKFANKAKKARKCMLEALEEEEIYDEWGEYFK